ncbi:MAG: efflux RND transporter periplasmic adaptor subunit [Massilia sp.]|nr:efflux RND transporter periplasmic adaptor subunit [Massilia sp.]
MKDKTLGVMVAAAAIIATAAWYVYGVNEQAKASAKSGAAPAPTVVGVVTPKRQDVPVFLRAHGTVTPVSSVDLRAQTTSTIRTVHIKEGQFVKAGQLMFSLDGRADLANVDKARAQIERDQAALADVERQYKRGEELVAQHFLAQSAVDTLRSQVESARALLGADLAALRAARVSASYSAIAAPMAGRVGAISVFPGSLVQPSTSLTTIIVLDPIDVAFTLPESSLGDMLAAKKRGAVAVEASVGARPVSGILSFIDNTVDPVAGTIRVKARFDNRDSALWPGQYVNTRVTVQTLAGAVVIPQAAIIINTRGTFVYVVGPDQSAVPTPVVRLHGFGINAAVSGLTGTEQVITEGKQNLRPGGKVRVAEAVKVAGAAVAPGSAPNVARKDH